MAEPSENKTELSEGETCPGGHLPPQKLVRREGDDSPAAAGKDWSGICLVCGSTVKVKSQIGVGWITKEHARAEKRRR